MAQHGRQGVSASTDSTKSCECVRSMGTAPRLASLRTTESGCDPIGPGVQSMSTGWLAGQGTADGQPSAWGRQRGVGGSARPALSRTRPKRAETHGDRDPKAKRAKPVSCMLFKAMPRPPNSEVKVRPTSLIQIPCHQLARETPDATKERLG